MTVSGHSLDTIAVIDDDPSVRMTYTAAIDDLGLTPVDIKGPLHDIDSLFAKQLRGCQAVITDLNLRTSGYSKFDGGEIAVEGVRRRIPILVCTGFSDVNQKLLRYQRRRAPSIFHSTEFNESLILPGLEKCFQEIDGRFTPDRRPWRTQVEVVDHDVEREFIWVIVMGRSPDEKVGISINELPEGIRRKLRIGSILHAKVNTGARSAQELFFDEWEPR